MYEIELKAWVDDEDGVRRRLGEIGRFVGAETKEDVYLASAPGPSGEERPRIRLRSDAHGHEITVKAKRIERGVETSREITVAIDDPAAFLDLAAEIGYRPILRKRKRSEVWEVDGVRAELNRVDGLGTFLEIEVQRPSPDPAARGLLFAVLHRAGVGEDRVEPKPYQVLLAERGLGAP